MHCYYSLLAVLFCNVAAARQPLTEIFGTPKNASVPPLEIALDNFDWMPYERAHGYLSSELVTTYQQLLLPYLEIVPSAALVTERPQTLRRECDAERYASFLTGELRKEPVAIYDFIVFGYELDLLEIHLYELNDTVDAFIILEATRTQRGLPKPLFLQRNIERFAPFRSKIVHYVVDDNDLAPFLSTSQGDRGNNQWDIEYFTRNEMYRRFNRERHYELRDNDLILHADTDEIARSDYVFQLKHCELFAGNKPQFHFGSINTVNHFGWARRNGRSVPRLFTPKTVADCGGTLNTAIRQHMCRRTWTVLPYQSANHMGRSGGAIMALYKLFSMVENAQMPGDTLKILRDVRDVHEKLTYGGRVLINGRWDERPAVVYHIENASTLWRPWFAEANRHRFPLLYPVGWDSLQAYSKDQS